MSNDRFNMYWKRLKAHPGVKMASLMTVLGALAGMGNENFSVTWGALWGASIMGAICWSIVLWTARSQPLPKQDDTYEQR